MDDLLRKLQERFVACLQHDTVLDTAWLKPMHALPVDQQLAVYRDSIQGNAQLAVAGTFPRCEQLMGANFWAGFVGHFVQHVACETRDFITYGAKLADYVAQFPPLEQYPYLADFIRLEAAHQRAYHGQQATVLAVDALDDLPEERQGQCQFSLQPDASLIASDYALDELWVMTEPHEATDRVVQPLSARGCQLYVFRREEQVLINPVDSLTYCVLERLHEHCLLSELFECVQYPEEQVMTTLITCIQRGWIGGLQIAP